MARVTEQRGLLWVTVAPGPEGNGGGQFRIRGGTDALRPLGCPGGEAVARSVGDE